MEELPMKPLGSEQPITEPVTESAPPVTTPTEPPKKKRGRPKKKLPPPDDPRPQSKDEPKEKKPMSRCAFMVTKNTSQKVLVSVPDIDGVVRENIESRMVVTEEQCPNLADGINGFCLQHSYPIKAQTYRVIPVEVISTEADATGKPVTVTKIEQKRMIFNIGEHLPAQHYTPEEIENLYNNGTIGYRQSQTSVDSNRNKRDMSDVEIDAMLTDRMPQEIVGILNAENFSEVVLYKILSKTSSTLVTDKIRELLRQ